MAFDVGSFRSAFDSNQMASHSDKFDCIIVPPAALLTSGVQLQSQYTCENAELPGVDITPLEYRHHAFVRRIPFHLTYAPITLTFYCTGGMNEKKYFDAWMNMQVDHSTGFINYRLNSSGTPNYETTIYLNQYATDGQPAYFAKLEDAMPVSVSPINLNWSDDSIERLAVTFVYTRWFTYQDGDAGFFTNSPTSTGPLLLNLSAEFKNLENGVQNLLKSGNPYQVFTGINQVVSSGTDIFHQVNNFANAIGL